MQHKDHSSGPLDYDFILKLSAVVLLAVLILGCALFIDEIAIKVFYRIALARCERVCNFTEEELQKEFDAEKRKAEEAADIDINNVGQAIAGENIAITHKTSNNKNWHRNQKM